MAYLETRADAEPAELDTAKSVVDVKSKVAVAAQKTAKNNAESVTLATHTSASTEVTSVAAKKTVSPAKPKKKEKAKPSEESLVADLHKTVAKEPARIYCAASFQDHPRKYKKLLWEVRKAESFSFEKVAHSLFQKTQERLQSMKQVLGRDLKAWCLAEKKTMLG